MGSARNIAVIGSGISSLCAAAILAQEGHNVTVLEKNDQLGGRMRQFSASGFNFDMGPSWYWMPDVFERFYNRFNYASSDFYHLVKLDPGFQVIYGPNEAIKVPARWNDLLDLFESIEPGAADKLKKFMEGAEYKYHVGVSDLIYRPGLAASELLTAKTILGLFRLQLFSSFSSHVRKYFKDERLLALMEFPILFLGAKPQNTPALYSLMNYAGLKQGTYYPMGGFTRIIDAISGIAREKGVEFRTAEPVQSIRESGQRLQLTTPLGSYTADGVIAGADYHHVDAELMQPKHSNYSDKYWKSRVFAPSCLLFYLGVSKKVDKLEHHNLFFDENFTHHARDIYSDPKWPDKPLFYVCCPSKTDSSVAPVGKENIFILMPIAAGLEDNENMRKSYFDILLKRLETFTGTNIRSHIEFSRSYCVNDFVSDYNAYKGNAYGLANTLLQTANLKPKIKNRSLPNFYYTGQLTVPGPGVPPAIVSGQVAAAELIKQLNRRI